MRTFWFERRRSASWIDNCCFVLHAGQAAASLSFGIEHAQIRTSALEIAEQIAPRTFSASSLIDFTEASCLCMFQASTDDASDHRSWITGIDEAFLSATQSRHFARVDSESRYLDFLMNAEGVFEWRRSAAAFRILYVCLLRRRLGPEPPRWQDDWCERVTSKWLEAHIPLRDSGLSAEQFVDACVDRVWAD